jgi:hypothetical protein
METTSIQEYRTEVLEVSDTPPRKSALKLADMKAKLGLVQRFFKEVMIKDQDYGLIPGTDKPTLLKPGAEKLCEFYGYAPRVKHVEEEKNTETGFYRARVTVALVHRRSGVVVAEGVGEANTLEGRYRWRWVPEWKLPEGIDKTAIYSETRKDKNGKTYRMYRLENQDPWTLWNTVLKMGKKRALIDATLSATRSSGIFTQDTEDLAEWVSGVDNGESAQPAQPVAQSAQKTDTKGNKPKQSAKDEVIAKVQFYAGQKGYDPAKFSDYVAVILCESYEISSVAQVTEKQWQSIAKHVEKLLTKAEERYVAEEIFPEDSEEEAQEEYSEEAAGE